MVILPGCPCCGETGPCSNGCSEDYTTISLRFQIPAASGSPWVETGDVNGHPRATFNIPAVDETIVIDRVSSQTTYTGTAFSGTVVRSSGRICSFDFQGQSAACAFTDCYYSGYTIERSYLRFRATFSTDLSGAAASMFARLETLWAGIVSPSTYPSDAGTSRDTLRSSAIGSSCSSWTSWPVFNGFDYQTGGVTDVGEEYGNGWTGSANANNLLYVGTAIRRIGPATVSVAFS